MFLAKPVKLKVGGGPVSCPTDPLGILCFALALESVFYPCAGRAIQWLEIAANRVRYPSFIFLGGAP